MRLRLRDKLLIAEAETDAQGNFSFELAGGKKYNGEAFDVDVYCGTVPGPECRAAHRTHDSSALPPCNPVGGPVRIRRPRSITGSIVCRIVFGATSLSLLGLWTICGRVTTCGKEQVAVAGVKVSAFDVDWWQDDPLGSAITDADGKFRIDYFTEDFQVTPFSPLINVECTSGPDLYFKIEDSGGNTLLNESSSRGREPDRENVGNCFCVDLCVDVNIPPPFKNPWFTHVGDFHILTDISAVNGLTNSAVLGHGGPNYGFFGCMKLKGFCPKTSPIGAPSPMRYRFRYATLADPGTLIPITGDKVCGVIVGSRLIQWKVVGDVLSWTFQTIQIAGAGATPDPTPTPGGPGPWGCGTNTRNRAGRGRLDQRRSERAGRRILWSARRLQLSQCDSGRGSTGQRRG